MSPSPQLAFSARSCTASIDLSPIRVVLADDHRLVRRNIRLLLETDPDVEVVAEAGDLFTAIRHVRGHFPNVLLLDLRMPNGSSIQAIRRLHEEAPETEIVVVTIEESPAFAQQAIDAGARGYVLKDNTDGELSLAVRHAAMGETYISRRVMTRLEAMRRGVETEGLSPREAEVLRLIALGLTSAEISERLHLSRRTVEAHRRRIHRKLGLGKRSEVVRYAVTHGLVGDLLESPKFDQPGH